MLRAVGLAHFHDSERTLRLAQVDLSLEPLVIDLDHVPQASFELLGYAVVLVVQTERPTLSEVVPDAVDIRLFYQQQSDVTVLQIEDELVESEGLVANSSTGYRTLFKANAICSTGSKMLFVVAAEVR